MPRYKRLGSAIYNFGSSFVSMMSWYDGSYTVDTLACAARQFRLDEIEIEWWRHDHDVLKIEPKVIPEAAMSERLQMSLTDYRAQLPRLFMTTGAALELLHWLRMRLFFDWEQLAKERGLCSVPVRCMMAAEDDRGRSYEVVLRSLHAHLHEA